MSRIKNAFTDGKAFIAFITGGDPNLDTTERLIYAMDKAGADLIEIGIPFSDPVAEGPVIQAASERALAAGCTTDKLFDLVAKVRKHCEKPIVFMTYINPVFTYGKDKFMAKCAECGIDGVIIPDIPFEEKDELNAECKAHGINLISLIAPTSHQRITMIAKEAEGFVYCVSSMGVTGIRNEINTDISSMIQLVKQVNDIPCAVGFGISTPEQAEKMASLSDGAIVGSAIVKLVEQYGENSVEIVSDYVKSMKAAVMQA
ncbi:MAG: tryptophan synthase subunit alpha [Lachnospiraceae bacterium]|nr:tryptophan synthase subunit alpha [Lachnospiraceae bacterium]